MKTLLQPKNWAKFQHYKFRSPPWIKVDRKLLGDAEFMTLPLASRGLAFMLWLLASEELNGAFKADVKHLAFRLHITEDECQQSLKPLLESGFFLDASALSAGDPKSDEKSTSLNTLRVQSTEREGNASNVLAECLQPASNPLAKHPSIRQQAGKKKNLLRSPNGSRLSPDWQMTDEQKQFCQKARPDLVPGHVEANFRDYWIGVAGKAGVKLDWMAVWRTWVRREKAGPKSYAQVNADTARITVEVNPDIAATLARNRADDAVTRTGPDLETLKKIKEIRDAARGAA